MKKIFVSLFLFGIFAIAFIANAQMMGGTAVVSDSDMADTLKEEAEGKDVWDKLQDKQLSCKDLKDEDWEVLGDFFMGNMGGYNHTSMNQLMAQRLGEEGEEQMHIAMGKRLSGCDVNAVLPSGSSYFTPMMGMGSTMMSGDTDRDSRKSNGKGMMGYGNMMQGGGFVGVLGFLTWILLVVFLISGSIFFWKRSQKKDI